jgi:hypothetical protein
VFDGMAMYNIIKKKRSKNYCLYWGYSC